jgi:octaprenyl-diphosphate synthase
VIAGAPDPAVRALHAYGDALGIAFQMTDDLLDYGGASGVIGKDVGDDFRERKLTLPVIRAVAVADAGERAFWERTIDRGQQEDGDLDRALAILARHGALESTRATALGWAESARTALAGLPAHPIRDLLVDLADYVVERIS